MANWKTDLAAFVEETTAFAKSLRVEPPPPRTIVEPDPMPAVTWMDSEREEIRQRVADFKAHQQRLNHGAEGLRRVRMGADARFATLGGKVGSKINRLF
jgi:hypothetical protein